TVDDLLAWPEIRWLDRYWFVVVIAVAALCLAWFGGSGLFVGYFLSTVVLFHATYTINSLAHRWGTRRYDTKDDSRNNLWLALLTFGEVWHNNHHHDMR